MSRFNSSYENRTATMQNCWKERQQQVAALDEEKNIKKQEQKLVVAAAREVGAHKIQGLWVGVINICKDDDARNVFLETPVEARLEVIMHYAGEVVDQVNAQVDDDDDWWEEFWKMLLEDDDEAAFIYGTYDYAIHLDKYCNRAAYRKPPYTGEEWVQNKLANETACYNMFRMSPQMFYSLHSLSNYGITSSTKSTSIEALAMFLWILGAPQSVRQAEDRFERSLGTVHNLFYKVLSSVLDLSADIIKPRDPDFTTMHPRVHNARFYPKFKGCIGAIDGTHIPVVVPSDKFMQHMCQKGKTTQNVMSVCDFDMVFTFVLAGWPGSVHDMRVLDDALTKYRDFFPKAPREKYYLVDSGYANRPGFLSPYRQTKYHIQDFQNAPEPQGRLLDLCRRPRC